MDRAFIKNVKDELRKANGFRIKLQIITFRLGFYARYHSASSSKKVIANLFYSIMKMICFILCGGEMPDKNVYIGWGLTLPHGFLGTVINYNAKIGKNCVMYSNVVIGQIDGGAGGAKNNLVIGDNVYIGASSLLIGDVTVGDNCKIGAGTKIINRQIPNNSTVINKVEYSIITNDDIRI